MGSSATTIVHPSTTAGNALGNVTNSISSSRIEVTRVGRTRDGHVGVACVCEHCGWVGGGGGGCGVCLAVELKVAGGWRWMRR
jgi:hypothetical protein